MQRSTGGRDGLLACLGRYRSHVQLGIDAVAWALALTFATAARVDFDPSRIAAFSVLPVIVLAVGLQALSGLGTGLYLGRRRFGSFEEVAVLARAVLLVTAVLSAVNLLGPQRLVPLSVTLGGGITALLLMGGARYLWRLFLERRRRPHGPSSRLLVFGAGEGATQVLTAMLAEPASGYLPVAIIDDDPAKQRLKIKTVAVVGTRADLADAAERFDAHTLLIAIPSAGAELIREVTGQAQAAGLDVRVVPSVTELLDSQVGVADIRRVSERDLLGRHEIDTDLESIADSLAGKRVLVTGAGGSIGSELCRQIEHFAPAALTMLDRDESALHAVQLQVRGHAALDEAEMVLADVRDRDRVAEVFAAHRPEIVFHAAALKHVTALEQHPGEAVKTNVWGTLHVLDAAAAVGVECFVNVSTDKAVNPVNVLGCSKRIAERLTAHVAARTPGTYLSVRFGNVLGSRGSVLPLFEAQVDAGGPVTVTHPEVTRYFMTIEEACQLVIQAAAVGEDGQALVLDMGEPVSVAAVAQRIAAQADPPVEVVYTGLRNGEKLHEELLGDDEVDVRPAHPLISHVEVVALDPVQLGPLANGAAADSLRGTLGRLTGAVLPPPAPSAAPGSAVPEGSGSSRNGSHAIAGSH